jgi:protease YdgD
MRALALAVLLVIVGLVPARARQLQADTWPWIAVGRVERGAMGAVTAEAAFCTGTLVAPDIVLTAAHCLHDHLTGALLPADQLEFAAGYSGGRWAARSVGRFVLPAEAFCMACDPGEQRSGADWGLLVLAQALPVPPVPLAPLALADVTRLSSGLPIRSAGFSVDDPETLHLHSGCRVSGHAGLTTPWRHDCRLSLGDSGAPLFVGKGNTWAVVAIHVAVQGQVGLAVPTTEVVGLLRRLADRTGAEK